MSASITVTGFVATQPKFVIVGDNLAISSFRLGASNRRFNPTTRQWENGSVSWYTVSCFRDLASNAFASLNKGDPVVVAGQLKVSEWTAGDKSGLDVEITAEAVGHDLRWGKAIGFARTPSRSAGQSDGDHQAEEEQLPSEEHSVPPVAAWANPAEAIASATSADAGEPVRAPAGVDARTGELVEAEQDGPPF